MIKKILISRTILLAFFSLTFLFGESQLTTLHDFNGNDGEEPRATLVLNGDYLYGTTSLGGDDGLGTLFRIKIDGTGFEILKSFTVGGFVYNSIIFDGNTFMG